MNDVGTEMTVEEALAIFDLEPPVTPERVDDRYQTLRHTWHPKRYANMTNNPRKYTRMYKKAEKMLKDVEAAYRVLTAWLVREATGETRHLPNVDRQP